MSYFLNMHILVGCLRRLMFTSKENTANCVSNIKLFSKLINLVDCSIVSDILILEYFFSHPGAYIVHQCGIP